jgi:ribosomal protein S18 acetylase RimI-like enzyme
MMIGTAGKDVNFEVRPLISDEDLRFCAGLMARSAPWRTLFFSEEQCMVNLSNPLMTVHLAVSAAGVRFAFLATLPMGLGSEPLLEYVCVHEDHRNAGIGTKLIAYFEAQMYGDAANVYLFVSDINPDAVRLYERLGYERVGVLPNYNLVAQTEYLYRKYRRPRQGRARPSTACSQND